MEREKHVIVSDPAFTTYLLNSTRSGWIWAVLRIYLGYEWLNAGWHKITGGGWLDGGAALKGFWTAAVAVPAAPAKPAVTYDWYRGFLQFLLSTHSYTWFARLIAVGETTIGICLVLGLLTGFAAFAGAFLNFNFMLAGSASTNPVLFIIAMLLILAWKVAGFWGLDRWVLPYLGTPWGDRPKERALA